MKNKLEQKLDEAFRKMQVSPYVFHVPIRFISTISNVTVIALDPDWDWSSIKQLIYKNIIGGYKMSSRLLDSLKEEGIYGVAICDKRDQFNKQRGRTIAKGRLLKHLKETAK